MNKHQSFLSPDLDAFVAYQSASGRWNHTYEANLRVFDRHCSKLYPDAKVLTHEIVDSWCAKRATETNNSCIARIKVVSGFVKYLRMRGKTDIARPTFPKRERSTFIPHAFTEDELKRFFHACDNLPSVSRRRSVRFRRITIPVFYRLLYSSGIRTHEARMLRVCDVDLTNGILNIRCSKGKSQHYVVLHDHMLDLMRKYDAAIDALHPGREYFFPSPRGSHYSNDWVCTTFRELWYKHNTAYATAYALRHHYATENINQWVGNGFGFDSKLLYLSKSMGHCTLESTRYYYSLVPVMSDIMEATSGQSFDDIVPEVDYEEGR